MAKSWSAKNKYRHAMTKSNLAINMERVMACTNCALWSPWMASKSQKQPKLVQKNNKKFVYCTGFDCFG